MLTDIRDSFPESTTMKSSSLKISFFILIFVAVAPTMICTGACRPLPVIGGVPPDTIISCTVPPATKRFYKKKRLSLSSSVSPSLSSLSVVAAPRCGYTPDLTSSSEKRGTANNNSIVGDFVTRFAILLVGCAIGFILYFPNVAMSDSVDIGSSREAVWAAAPTIGIVACRARFVSWWRCFAFREK